MIDNARLSKTAKCEKHFKPLVSICIAPQCWNFRELCQSCIRDDIHHAKMHYDRSVAFMKIQQEIDNIFKGLKALRKKIIQTMDTKVDSQIGMNEIQLKLDEIKQIFNKKIDNFHSELRKIYEKNVKEKLNQLFYIVEKSYQFLQEQKIKLFKSEKLRPFFVNDLSHDLKYYESYYEQILQKNIRRFKAGFQHDKVLKMMVSFEQNLSQIFKFQTTTSITNINNHILYANDKGHCIFRIKGYHLAKNQLHFIGRQNCWVGIMPSVFYPPTDSYYLIGDGQRQSNKIRRMNLINQEIKDFSLKLETKRMNFAICLFNHEIFVVGGQNSKEGCLAKCQKFVPSEGKVYIVSSLNQRSAQHSLCVYKNKFILKFGGTDVMASILQAHTERYHPLNPEIYSAETEDWKIISFHSAGSGFLMTRINFGLWPGIFSSNTEDKVIILSGEQLQDNNLKFRYDFEIEQSGKQSNQIKEIALECYKTSIPSKNRIISQCCSFEEDGKIFFLVMDQLKGGIFFNASISKKATQFVD